MRAIVLNIILSLFILKPIIFQKTFVSGQMQETITLQSCAVKMTGLNLRSLPGDRGDRGTPGLRGFRGDPGTCIDACPPPRLYVDRGEYEGKKPTDALISCKNNVKKESVIEVCEESPFVVKCEYNGTNTYTCLKKTNETIITEENGERIFFALGNRFWFSKRRPGFNLKDFYFGYDMSQIEYLQSHSEFTIQKIRFHCKNTIPEKSLQMLSWQEQLVRPVATDLSPFHYVIESDGCKDSNDTWSHTDFKLLDHLGRLPVIDFSIGSYDSDNPNWDQKFNIELLELCFGH